MAAFLLYRACPTASGISLLAVYSQSAPRLARFLSTGGKDAPPGGARGADAPEPQRTQFSGEGRPETGPPRSPSVQQDTIPGVWPPRSPDAPPGALGREPHHASRPEHSQLAVTPVLNFVSCSRGGFCGVRMLLHPEPGRLTFWPRLHHLHTHRPRGQGLQQRRRPRGHHSHRRVARV